MVCVPASPGQRLLWFLDRYRGADGALNVPLVCEIDGPLDVARLTAALMVLGGRHEALRTRCRRSGRHLVQDIWPVVDLTPDRVDGTTMSWAEVAERVTAECRTPIPVDGPLVRVRLWRCSTVRHVLVITMHHLICDTWSTMVLLEELAVCYRTPGAPDASGLPPVGWQYRHFAAWQDRQLAADRTRASRAWWRDRLAGATAPPLLLRPDPPAEAQQRSTGSRLSSGSRRRVAEVAAQHSTTSFGVLLACYYALLRQISGTDDVTVSSVFANRDRPETERTVGFVANLLLLRADLSHCDTLADVVAASRDVLARAVAEQNLPAHLMTTTAAPRGRLRVDDVVLQLLAEPLERTWDAGPVRFAGQRPDVAGRFRLELALMPVGTTWAARLFYDDSYLAPQAADSLLRSYVALADHAVRHPAAPLPPLPEDATNSLRAGGGGEF